MAELSEQPEPETSAPRGEARQEKPKARMGILFPVFILALIFGLAGAGYYFLTQIRSQQEGLGGQVKSQLAQQINDYQKQLTAIQSQLSTLQSEINGKDEHFNKTLEEFTDLHSQKMEATRKEINDKVLQVQRQLGKTRGDWLVADAEYLLSVANERLHLIGDVNTTRAALEAADQRLRESGDTGVIKVREEIAKELSLLKDIIPPDIVGLYAAIQALQGDIGKLSLALPYAGKPLTSPEEAAAEPAASPGAESNDLLNSAIQELHGIVTIKHSDSNVKEILTEEQAQFIREQLRIKLEIVKSALAHQNEELFQVSLKDLKTWLEQNFTKNDESRRFMDELTRLESIKLRSHFPDISKSLKQLRDLTSLRIETDKTLEPGEEKKTDNGAESGQLEAPAVNSGAPAAEKASPAAPAPGSAQPKSSAQ